MCRKAYSGPYEGATMPRLFNVDEGATMARLLNTDAVHRALPP